jgi:hypothetical protein
MKGQVKTWPFFYYLLQSEVGNEYSMFHGT